MTRFEPGDKIRIGNKDTIKGEIISIEKEGESPVDTIYSVEVPDALGKSILNVRELYMDKDSCEKHRVDTVYSSNREEWYCPFCST